MQHPLVVGYKGEIGSFILSGLLRIMPKALDIWCIDIKETEDEIESRITASDVIFLCIPLQITVCWLKKYKHLLTGKIIIEQCSIKEDFYKEVEDNLKGLDIRSMHILFRPSQTHNPKDRKVGLFLNQTWDTDTVSKIEKITQSQIIWYKNAENHDREMAIQQALLHRTILILGEFIRSCNGSTYISSKILELEERIKNGDKELYSIIQGNKYLPSVLLEINSDFKYFDINNFWPE